MSQSLREAVATESGEKTDISFKVKNKDGSLVRYENLDQFVNTLSPNARAVLTGTSGTSSSERSSTPRRRRKMV